MDRVTKLAIRRRQEALWEVARLKEAFRREKIKTAMQGREVSAYRRRNGAADSAGRTADCKPADQGSIPSAASTPFPKLVLPIEFIANKMGDWTIRSGPSRIHIMSGPALTVHAGKSIAHIIRADLEAQP